MADAVKEVDILEALQITLLDGAVVDDRVEIARVTPYDEGEPFPRINILPGEANILSVQSGLLIWEQNFTTEIHEKEHEFDLIRCLKENQRLMVALIMRRRHKPILGLDFIRDLIPTQVSELSLSDIGPVTTLVRNVNWNIKYETTEQELADE